MCAVLRTGRRALAALVLTGVAVLTACSAERSVPLALPPQPPPPTVDSPSTTQVEPIPTAPPSDPPSSTPSSTPGSSPASAVPTTVAATEPAAWAAFDQALSSRLIDHGDYAVAVAVAMHGTIIHAADFG